MFNPFALLSKPLLEAFIQSGKQYFVRQTFYLQKHHHDQSSMCCYLITHYAEKGHAEHHFSAISEDHRRFLYAWSNPAHRERLIHAATQPAGFRIYANVFHADWEKHINVHFRQQLRNYVEGTLHWKPAVAETVAFDVFVHYGELYARLKLRTQEVRVKLAEIEHYR